MADRVKAQTGQELVDKMTAFVRRYVVCSEAQALTVALWALNTWVYERFSAVPYLEIWAKHKRSGKTTLAEILSAMSNGGRILATVRVMQMVRLIELNDGDYTPFVEEAERFEKGSLGDERSIIATGYRKGAVHELASPKGKLTFRTFSPKAFVLIGNVHEIIRDRCISILLGRGTPEHNWTLERHIATSEIEDMIKDWREVAKGMDVIKSEDGIRFKAIDPIWLNSPRDRELWTPLFSLAGALRLHKDTVGLLQRASVDLSILKTLPAVKYRPAQEENAGDDVNSADAVLRDMRTIYKPGETFLPTDEVLTRLWAIDVAPWRGWRGEGLNSQSLSALLIRFGIEPVQARIKGKGRAVNPVRGYRRADIDKPQE